MSKALSKATVPMTPAVMESAFARLHPKVQRQLWRMGWSHLRPMQVESIHAVLGGEAPLLVSAATASGKTEAVFLPLLSRLVDDSGPSVRALYVGPLRALINDQFSRLEDLCEHLDIPVHRWHGEVGIAAKRRLVEKPGGVLLLTPESLESLFVNRSPHMERMFRGLEYVVIDELHVFLGTERGRQLQSLLCRLEKYPEQPARRIGLSATVGKAEGGGLAARNFLAPGQPESVLRIDDDAQKPLGYRVHCYVEPEHTKIEDIDELAVERLIAADIARHFTGLTSLIFANKRGDVETFADMCRPLMPNLVAVHHGSLARDIREETEEKLKTSHKNRAVTAFCSSTLELGIDLGDVAAVGQIGPPPSVASLKQRLGRSGRKEDQERILRAFALDEPGSDAEIFERLYLPLLQTVSATELMLAQWVEAPREASCDLSTLTQQILSVIAQHGGIGAAPLYDILCRKGAFSGVEPVLFGALLRCLGDSERQIIEQMPGGELILGLKGEAIRNGRDFYAVFLTPEEYALSYQGHLLGSLPIVQAPPPGEELIFAGRRWRVISLDESRRQIFVEPCAGKKRPRFEGTGAIVHHRLRQGMREVLASKQEYRYLDFTGSRLIGDARAQAKRTNLLERPLVALGPQRTAIMLWTGDCEAASVALLLAYAGVSVETNRLAEGVAVICGHSVGELPELLEQALEMDSEALELAQLIPDKRRRKYDALQSDELLEIGLARDWLDVEAARRLVSGVLGG